MSQTRITPRNIRQEWIGYKVHLTETCEPDAPHLITHVETTAGPVSDGDVTEQIHAALQAKDLLPDKHRSGYRLSRCRITGN